MRVTARHLFEHALAESSIDRAFEQHVVCERGVLRVREDLYDLHTYHRVFVVSLGKAAHTMVNALEMQAGDRFEGIVASSIAPASQIRGFRYFLGGHPAPNQESIRAAEAMLKSLDSQDASSLVIFLLSGGGSSIAEKPIDDEISLEDLIATYQALVRSGSIDRRNQRHPQAFVCHQGRQAGPRRPSGAAGFDSCVRRSRQHARCPGLRPHHARFHFD